MTVHRWQSSPVVTAFILAALVILVVVGVSQGAW